MDCPHSFVMKPICAYLVVCCLAVLLAGHVSGQDKCETAAEFKQKVDDCKKEIPDSKSKPGCVVKCYMQKTQTIKPDGKPDSAKIGAILDKCNPVRKDPVLECVKKEESKIDSSDANCKGYEGLRECW